VIGIIGVVANVLLRKLEARLLRWRAESRGQA
jgi:ABC-type nitrate/sulfonate/bicarbonate transport system permease component